MDGPYRSSRFDTLLVQSGRLVADTTDHERGLNDLTNELEQAGRHDLVANARRLCAAASEQRQKAETLHAGLLGEPVHQQPGVRPVVLIVDDSKDGAEAAALFLELAGFHTITAANGLEALIVAHYARPEVAVLDMAMPVLNGLEAARLLKASPVTRNTRLMAYTANWSLDDAALKEVFAETLSKSASADEFLAAVQQLAANNSHDATADL